MVSTGASRLRETSQKHPRLEDASQWPRIEECLPGDVLEAIMGHLDRETLCTARLVSKTFCAAASAHVHSLTLASTIKAVSFRHYPNPKHVTVTHDYANLPDEEEENLAQLDPYLRDLATALTIGHTHYRPSAAQTRDFLSQAVLMPKLRKLVVKGDVEHEAALLARCTNLEALVVFDCSMSVAMSIVTMTQLSSLAISQVQKDGHRVDFADVSWLGHATNLRNLRALSIHTFDTSLPLLGNLTALTGLTCAQADEALTCSIAPLTRLTRLRSLGIDHCMTDSNLGIACSLGSGSLANLELSVCEEASAGCGSLLSHQTALTRLSLRWQLCNLRHIGALRIELLQSLEIEYIDMLDAEGLSVLSRATSLTHLDIVTGTIQPQLGLSQVLARLTQLRSLSLGAWQEGATIILDFHHALRPLTGLTKLSLCRQDLEDGDLRGLLVLTGLRVLELFHCNLPDEVLPELGSLTSLNILRLYHCGVTSLAPVSEVLDPLRKARGLPPLHACAG